MLNDFAELFKLIIALFFNGGWILFVLALTRMFYILYIDYIQRKWYDTIEWVFLKVSVPRENEKSPLAFEAILNQLHSIHGHLTWAEKYLEGQFFIWFVWEITSIGGVIGNYVRIPKKYRDNLESAIYAQFPAAEITEAEDYFETLPKYHTDTSEYDIFAFSFRYIKENAYPMSKSYHEFEHPEAETIVDPIAGLWEELGKLNPYEMFVMQFMLRPISDESWKEQAFQLVKVLKKEREILQEKPDKLLAIIGAISGPLLDFFIRPTPKTIVKRSAADELPPSMMLHLSEGEKAVIAAVERKISKWAYQTKIHCLYLAPRAKYNPGPINNAVIGAIKNFGGANLNALKPLLSRWTRVHYWLFQKWEKPIVTLRLKFRKRKYMRLIRTRWYFWGPPPNIMSTEELASILHFPGIEVTVPQIERVEVTKVQPPPELPVVT